MCSRSGSRPSLSGTAGHGLPCTPAIQIIDIIHAPLTHRSKDRHVTRWYFFTTVELVLAKKNKLKIKLIILFNKSKKNVLLFFNNLQMIKWLLKNHQKKRPQLYTQKARITIQKPSKQKTSALYTKGKNHYSTTKGLSLIHKRQESLFNNKRPKPYTQKARITIQQQKAIA